MSSGVDDHSKKEAVPQVKKTLIACVLLLAVSTVTLFFGSSQVGFPYKQDKTREVRFAPKPVRSSYNKLGNCWALFLAVQNYDDPNFRDLKAPINDANTIAAELKKYYGWHVEVVPDPDMETIILKLNQYASKKYKDDDQLFVSVGAHGNWEESTKEGFVLARDAEKNDPSLTHGYIPFSRLKDVLSKGNCKHTLLALDVCYAGAFFESIASGTRSDDHDESMPLKEVLDRKMPIMTRKVLASGELNPVYDVGPSGHSPFVTRLLTVLRTYGGKEHFLRFADFAKPVVETRSGGLADGFDNDKPGSDFVFVPISTTNQSEENNSERSLQLEQSRTTEPPKSTGASTKNSELTMERSARSPIDITQSSPFDWMPYVLIGMLTIACVALLWLKLPGVVALRRRTTAIPDEVALKKNKDILLNKLKKVWIDDVLEKSPDRRAILVLEELSHAAEPKTHTTKLVLKKRRVRQKLARAITTIKMVTTDNPDLDGSRSLLLLGTTTGNTATICMLELARHWLELAQGEHSICAIPIILELSSWEKGSESLSNWIVEEAHKNYEIAPEVTRFWIENRRLRLLLDGLDNLPAPKRLQFSREIDSFRLMQGPVDVVVTSRKDHHDELSEKLRLQRTLFVSMLNVLCSEVKLSVSVKNQYEIDCEAVAIPIAGSITETYDARQLKDAAKAASKEMPTNETTPSICEADFPHAGSFKKIVFLFDDLRNPLTMLLVAAFRKADEAGVHSIAVPILRLHDRRKSPEEDRVGIVKSMVSAVMEFSCLNPTNLQTIEFFATDKTAAYMLARCLLALQENAHSIGDKDRELAWMETAIFADEDTQSALEAELSRKINRKSANSIRAKFSDMHQEQFAEAVDTTLSRAGLLSSIDGVDFQVYEQLVQTDPEAALIGLRNDVKRILRRIAISTGLPSYPEETLHDLIDRLVEAQLIDPSLEPLVRELEQIFDSSKSPGKATMEMARQALNMAQETRDRSYSWLRDLDES